MSTAVVNVALAGIAGYGDWYLDALLNDPRAAGVRLVGVVDAMPHRCRRTEELNARHVPIHPSFDRLFERSRVDLVMIATPIHLHANHTVAALRNGAHVLCEKPVASTLPDARRMAEAQRASGQFVAVGFQWSFNRAVQALKRDVMSGALGRPVRLKSLVSFPRPAAYFRRNDWAGRLFTDRGEPVFDSPVNNACSHYLHNMLYLLGDARETSAAPAAVQAELYRANDIENYDTAALRCVTKCGAELLFYTTHAAPQKRGPVCHFEFTDAVVEFDADDGAARFVATFNDGRVRDYGQPNVDRSQTIWQAVDSVVTGGPVACDITAALPHATCVAAAQASSPHVGLFPAALRRTVDCDGSPMVTIDGLGAALAGCYDRGVLPSEHGDIPWARAGTPVEISPTRDPRRAHAPVAAAAAARV